MTESAARPTPPRVIQYAIIAAIVQLVFTVIRVATVWGSTSEWKQFLVKANTALASTDKSKKSPYTQAEISHDLHSLHTGITGQSLLLCVAVGLCAYAFWRGRGIARWLYIIASLFFSGTGITALSASSPKPFNVAWFVSALAALVSIVLLILPESARYFAATKALRLPPGAARPAGGGASARPTGLRGLLAPPPPRPTGATNQGGTARPTGLRALFAPPPRPDKTTPSGGSNARGSGSSTRSTTGTGATGGTTAKSAPAGKRKPASTRPAPTATSAGTESAVRGKPKARSGPADSTGAATGPGDAPAASSEAPPARARGKSRRV